MGGTDGYVVHAYKADQFDIFKKLSAEHPKMSFDDLYRWALQIVNHWYCITEDMLLKRTAEHGQYFDYKKEERRWQHAYP
jgi:hypothetical protein